MANNDRWRDDQERNRYRDDDRRWGDRGQDYGRGYDYEGDGTIARRGFGHETSGYARDYGSDGRSRGGRGTEGIGDIYGGGGAYGSDDRGAGMRAGDQDRSQSRGSGREEYNRGGRERDFGGNDYSRGFYGADQGYRRDEHGPHQDTWGYRGERGGWDRFSDEVSSWFGDENAARRREQDARQGDQGAQHHRGRGPKGYTRSDERIREDVNERLTDDPYVDASEIEVSVSGCEVTLTGTVDSREAKRRAEDCAERVSGVRHVQNNLRVQQGTNQGTAAGTAGSIAIGSTTGAAGTGMSGAQGGSQEAGGKGTGRRKTGATS
jgi:osmotically-inducible protein OsmY